MSSPFSLKSRADAIHLHGHSEQTAAQLYRSQVEAMVRFVLHGRRNEPLSPFVVAGIIRRPEIVMTLGPKIEGFPELMAAVLCDPDVLLEYVVTFYGEAAEKYEDRLLGNGMGQYVYELLATSRRNQVKLRQPYGYYEAFLTRDPYWGLRYAKEFKDQELTEAISRTCMGEATQHARAAFYYLLSNQQADVSQFVPLFDNDAEYAYLGLVFLAKRGFHALNFDRASLTPRWAYHFLMSGAKIDHEVCKQCLLTDPAWLVQWMVDAGVIEDPQAVAELYKACTQAIKQPHPNMDNLHAWFNRFAKSLQTA